MSLDVYLTTPVRVTDRNFVEAKIFVRENGQVRVVTYEEWNERFPGTEPLVLSPDDGGDSTCVFWANITHNLNRMAEEAGIYQHLWRPDELGIKKASELIEPLTAGLARMKADRSFYETFNAPNGWGTYADFVPWIESYLAACIANPDAEVSVSR